jgi:hypothetical protein
LMIDELLFTRSSWSPNPVALPPPEPPYPSTMAFGRSYGFLRLIRRSVYGVV